MALRPGGDQLVVSNLLSDEYPDITLPVDPNQVGRLPVTPTRDWRLGTGCSVLDDLMSCDLEFDGFPL